MENRWVNALVKTLIFLAIAHVILLILGLFIRTDVGVFGIPMIWAHWSDGWITATIGLVATAITYAIAYFCCTGNGRRNIEGD